MEKKLYKCFHPSNLFIISGVFIIIVSLFYLIFFDKFNTPISYVLYLLMSYSFILFCIKMVEIIKVIMDKMIDNNKYLSKYRNNPKLRHRISLFCSIVLNIIYVIFKLVMGIWYKSLWLISFAIYYFILVITRINIAKEELKRKVTLKEEYLKYRKTGITLLLVNLFLVIIILVIVNQKIIIRYNQIISIAIAAYTFYLMISSIINLIRYRKYKSPLMVSAKVVNVVTSLISVLSLEIAMLGTFGAEKQEFNETMIMATGGGISIIIIIISLYMIINSTEWLNKE